MNKETVFFSHSSRDSVPLNLLKDFVKNKTSSTFEIFLSSDGQSIPFGSNWVHKIEQGLANAIIMFIFVTPNSIKSNWIYFEAGYSYSKEIRVIPVGVGVDIGSIKPPLNLLQGFNIASCDGLNNIIKVINDEFHTTFPENFTDEAYRIFSKYFLADNEQLAFDSIVDYIESEIFSYTSEDNSKVEINSEQIFDKCKEIISTNYNSYSTDKITLLSNGIKIKHVPLDSPSGNRVRITINASDLANHFVILKDIVKQSYSNKENHFFNVVLNTDFDFLIEDIKVSSLISKCKDISFGGSRTGSYKYKGNDFILSESNNPKTPEKKVFKIIFKQDTPLALIYELVNVLFDIGIVYKKSH